MFEWVLRSIGVSKAKGPRPSYEEAKVIASKGSDAERTRLATHADLEPELLYYLAEDKSVEVRKEIAANDGTPLQADKILAKDAIAEVRSELAYKIGRLIPSLTEQENERLTDMTFEVLEILTNDELPEVRAIISEEIKTLDTVPKPVVTKLAHDVEEIVSAPILEYSPLLTEQELVQIIAGGIQGAALMAVARRKELGENASAAVADTLDKTAITELLKNETARISQKTTDVIGMNAENTPEWHRPLIERSNLSLHTIKRIATFVSAAMVDRLIEVHGLSADIARELRQHVRERIEGDEEDHERESKPEPADRAKEMYDKGELTEENLQKAIEDGDITLIPPALALLSEMDDEIVKRILGSDSGKAVLAVVWKAGLGMETAEMVQRRVANVPAKSMLTDPGDGSFPISEGDMEWYLAYFEE